MSGSTSSTNILNAINQVIKALNDLATEVNVPDLSGVEQAISDLTLTCSPTVNVSSTAPSVVVYCSCGGGSNTSDPPFIPPDIDPEEGGTPPTGFDEPTEIDSRKCKAANYLYDGTLEVLDKFDILNIEALLAVGFGIMAGAIATLLAGVVSGLGAFLLGVFGGVDSVVTALTYQGVNISSLKTVWEDKHNEIICALYNATASRPAIDAVSEVLSDAGLSSANIAVFKSIFTVEVATILFFKPAMKGVTIEQDLDGYEVTVDCGVCGADIVKFRVSPGGVIISGDLKDGAIIRSVINSSFGSNRRQINLTAATSPDIIVYSNISLVAAGGETSFWFEWLDADAVYQHSEWGAFNTQPTTVTGTDFNIIGGVIGAPNSKPRNKCSKPVVHNNAKS